MSISVKNALAHRSRFSLTMTAVVLSVAFLTATLILADSLTGSAESDIATANADLAFVVEGDLVAQGDGGPGEALERATESLSPGTLDLVAAVDGVAETAPEVTGFAKLVADGEAVGAGTALDVGRNWIDPPSLNPFSIAEGSAPAGPDDVVVNSALAGEGGIAVGDAVQVLTATGLWDMTVSGLADFGPSTSAPLQRTLMFDDATTAAILDEVGLERVRATLDPGADLDTVIAAVEGGLADGVVIDGAAHIATQQNAITTPFTFLSLFLVAFAGIATVAGATIIVNTFAIAIAQRRRELALMRAVGATRSDVLRAVIGEAAIIAIVATAAGIALGLLGAGGLRAAMDTAGLSFIDGPTVVSLRTVIIAVGVGLLVTVGSAWAPARSAAGAAPVEALREASTEPGGVGRWRTSIGLGALAGGVASLIAAATQTNALLLTGGVLLVPGLIMAGPKLVEVTASMMRPALSRFAGVQGSMAATNLTRNPRRSASTSLGLTLGVAMVGFFSILASSFTASLTSTLDESLQADLVIASATTEAATIDPGLVDRIAQIDGVTNVGSLTLADASTADGSVATVGGVDPGIEALFDFGVVEGSFDALADGGVAVWTGAEGTVPAMGETVELALEDGTLVLPVVAVFDDVTPGFDEASHVVDATVLASAQSGLLDANVFVTVADDAATESVRAAVAATPGSLFETRASYLANAGSEIDAIRNLVYALLALTIVIAVVGVANTTALSISERVRELGLLRAVGTTERGVRQIVRYEAAVLAAAGALTGLGLAIGGSWALVATVGGAELPGITIPWVALTVICAGSIAAGVAAAAVPAWRASKTPTLAAIAGR
ncbi:MAG: ABC transporter permease [Actinomycetota bacterium]